MLTEIEVPNPDSGTGAGHVCHGDFESGTTAECARDSHPRRVSEQNPTVLVVNQRLQIEARPVNTRV